MTDYGVPGRLPLISRFSDAIGALNSISQWRTFILVNSGFKPKSMRCLSRANL